MKLTTPRDVKKEPDILLTKESLVFVRSWLKEHTSSVPQEILPFLLAMLDMCEDAQTLLKHNKKLVDLLRQHMGFVPTKERDGKDKGKNDAEEWTKEGESALHEKMKKAAEKWKEYKKNKPKKKKASVVKKYDPNSPAEEDTTDPESPPTATEESVFQLPAAQTETKTEDRPVDREDLPTGLGTLVSSRKSRTRYNVSLLLTTINLEVETVQCLETGFSRTATVRDDGPARFKITWTGMAQIVLLVVGMCIPLVRLASCLGASISYFSPSRIYRICLYTARACFAIYSEIFRQLSTCCILVGDDTNNVVLDMRQDNPVLSKEENKEQEKLLETSKAEPDPQKIALLLEAEEFLGTQMPTKNGKGFKKSIFTSVVIGQRPDQGPRATLVFYHSERKSFGDLIGKILQLREKNPTFNGRSVVIQSDLSSSNIPTPYPAKLSLVFIGCAAHARRPFWRYRNDVDPSIGYHCYTMLLLFDKVFDSDRDARATGNDKKILQARAEEQRPLWEEIKNQAQEILEGFAPNSEMANAANYIIDNFEKLTRYLTDPRLKPDNNRAERYLRYEKVMLDNSKFRVSKLGRLVYDILRTILATCTAAKASPFHYLVHVLKNQVDARKNPVNYTPFAFVNKEKPTMPLSNNE